MPCTRITFPGGMQAIACSRGRRSAPRCACGRVATKLCDFPLGGSKAGKTCDADICSACATTVGRVDGRIDAGSAALVDGTRGLERRANDNLRYQRAAELKALATELVAQMSESDTVDFCPAHARIFQASDEHANGGV